jgi:hypothetical protein
MEQRKKIHSFAKVITVCLTSIAVLASCARNSTVPVAPSVNSPTPQNPVSQNPIASPSPSGSPSSVPTPVVPQATNTPNPQAPQEVANRLSKLVSQSIGVPVQSVNCPANFEIKVGSRFDCEARSDGQPFAIVVEITNETGPQFKWSTQGLLLVSKLEQFIQKQIQDKSGVAVTASCGSGIRVANQGDTFECQVTNTEGQSRSAKVTVKNDQGDVDVSLI